MAESKRFDTKSTGCLEGLFNFLALNQRLQMPKMIAYRKHSEGSNNMLRVNVPKPKTSSEKDENMPLQKETNSDSQTGKSHMFIWRTLMFKKRTPGKDKKKSSSPASSPSSSRLLRSRSIHHSKCFDYEVPDELATQYHAMNNSGSSEMGSCHSEPPPLPHESPQHPNVQEPCRDSGSMDGKDKINLEAPCEASPGNLTGESEAPSTQKTRDAATQHSKEFLDFFELFNAHRELFLKILHDPSLLVSPEQQGQEASSSGSVPLSKLESFSRPGGSSGKRNPIFDRSDSEKSRSEIQMSPSRPTTDLEAAKVISTRMPTGVDGSAVSLAESRSLKKPGTTSNRFKAISRKIKDVVRENRKELARITKDGVFHKLPYGQKMSGLTRSSSTEKFVQEERRIRRSYSIAESVDKYSTLYESISRDPRISPERLSITMEGGASLNDKKMPMSLKRITSLPEMRLCSSHQEALPEVSASRIGSKTCNVESDHFSSHGTDALSICAEGNFYPDDVTEKSENIHIELNRGGFLEENFHSILRSPSLSSLGRSFSHRRINSLPSFDRSFFQGPTRSFTECSIADSEPPFENLQLEDEDWLVKPPLPAGAYAANFNDEEWLVTPLKHSGVLNGIDREDQEWLVKATQLSDAKDADLEDEEWLANSGQPITNDALDSDFRFIREFSEHGAAEPLHLYVSDKNEADFQYVKDILKKSGFSCGDVDWYASNQPVSPVVFDEAECSCQELSMASDEPHSIVRRMLLFDLINEVLLNIYDSSLVIGPWHSRFDLRTRPIPMGYHVLEEVWAKVSCYLSLHWKEGQTVEDIVAHDLMRKDNPSWMNLVYDAECTALDMEDLMVEDLLDDVVIQIVLESIDE